MMVPWNRHDIAMGARGGAMWDPSAITVYTMTRHSTP